jgi:hypothetical protein
MLTMPTVFGGAGLGVLTITAGTKIPARIPGTTKRMRGTAAIGFLPQQRFSAEN